MMLNVITHPSVILSVAKNPVRFSPVVIPDLIGDLAVSS